MLVAFLNTAPFVFAFLAVHAMFKRRVGEELFNKTVYGHMALFNFAFLPVDTFFAPSNSKAIIDCAFGAYWLYRWWNTGGGDGIKNFLQSLVMKPAHDVR
jgi:hypothetical protein